jgi:hypothetical protein
MIILVRLVAYALAAAVSFATLGPPSLRPHSDLGQNGEHALAFVLIGIAFALGYPRQRLLVASLTAVMTGVLELLQLFVPGRHARFEDFLVDADRVCDRIDHRFGNHRDAPFEADLRHPLRSSNRPIESAAQRSSSAMKYLAN